MASDAELISWSLSGDGEAFVELVDRHEDAVWAYLVRRVGRQVAEDLLGDVWTAAFAARRRYDRSFPGARPWLFGITLNTLRRHWRSQTAEDPTADLSDLRVAFDPGPVEDDRMDAETLLRRLLATIPPDEREVLFLVVWEQASVADAARALQVPAGTARRYLHQARSALRNAPEMIELLTQSNTVRESK